MARPLNKKYFGNRNVGTTGTSDNGIGGEGIASINWSNAGGWLATAGGASAPLAGLQLPAPTIPGGVQATWTNYFGIQAVTTGAGKTGLVVGDTYTYAGYPGSVITVASTSGANATFTVTTRGSSTTLITDLQTVSITKVSGSGAATTFTVDIFSQIVNTVITEKGSGYTGAETFTVTTANGATGTAPAGTIVLTTDSGSYGNSGNDGSNMNANNQENAIRMTAYLTGGSAREVDIIKQVGAKRFKVTDGTRTGVVTLQDSLANAAGEGSISAVDSDGGTYFITKIAARRATVARGTGTQFATGQSVPWNMTAAAEDVSVKISNA
jgi:hypothetical protein